MARKLIYESKLIPGVQFNSYDEAMKAEENLKRQKNESTALEAIGKYNRVSPSMQMAKQAGSDAWATAPIEDLQSISEGQTLNEMYGGPMGLARGYGITSNPSEPAKEFVSGLSKEITQKAGEGLKWKAQMEKDTPETKSRALESLEKLEKSGEYPSVNFDMWRSRILDDYAGAYQFNKVFTVGQTSTGEAVRKQEEMRPGKIKTEVDTGIAVMPIKERTAYLTKTAIEQAQRDIQKTFPMLSGENAVKTTQSALALKNLLRLRDQLEKGNVEYFDIIKKTGQFKNPNINNAFQQVSEIVGRQQSGAAISKQEWDAFGKEILNKNFLLTEAGQKTALENLNDYIDRFFSVGSLITSDENWYDTYNSRAQRQRESMTEPTGETGFTEEKRRRLEELRKKKAAGTLGK